MSDLILAIDPGPVKSGWLLLKDGVPKSWEWDKNDDLFLLFNNVQHWTPAPVLVIEDVSHFGPKISVGQDVFETCKWMGRFQQAYGGEATYIKRQKIKTHLTGMATAKDKNIRIALIDRYGGESVAIGGKKCQTCKGKGWRGRNHDACQDCHHFTPRETTESHAKCGCGYETHPGPLHGISYHVWSALAVAVTYRDTRKD